MRRHFSYANVAATLALVFAMSGTGLAATRYLINSTKQINPRVLKALRGTIGKSGTTGPQGLKGDPGGSGPQGFKGEAGAVGPMGERGEAGPFPTGDAPSGVTVRGNYSAGGSISGPGQYAWDSISFGFQFASPPAAHLIGQHETPPAQCPGSAANPQASPGNLCVYEAGGTGSYSVTVLNPGTNVGPAETANRWGAEISLYAEASGNVVSHGTWAATTP